MANGGRTNKRKRKGKILIKQNVSLKPTTRKNNVGNVGHPTLLANTGVIKVSIKRKT